MSPVGRESAPDRNLTSVKLISSLFIVLQKLRGVNNRHVQLIFQPKITDKNTIRPKSHDCVKNVNMMKVFAVLPLMLMLYAIML